VDSLLAVERIAMKVAIAAEQARGAEVRDVSSPAKARLAGLGDYPGFDLFPRSVDGERGIEVKGRVGTGDVESTENQWARAVRRHISQPRHAGTDRRQRAAIAGRLRGTPDRLRALVAQRPR